MLLLTEGAFGAAVAERYGANANVHALRDAVEKPSLLDGARFVAAVSWRPSNDLFDRLDERCRERAIPWMPTTLSTRSLVCGPVLDPAHRPCWRCFRARFLTHHPAPERDLALTECYDRDPERGVGGFVAPLVGIAAAYLRATAPRGREAVGRLALVDLLTAHCTDSHLIALHGCSRCGEQRPEVARERFTRLLVPALVEKGAIARAR